ncbi:LytR C-terminal domain-containing protein [Zafaria sp. Z1313]|uniref:LytR C-terminal domain-containing protein n=1 Tax=Zafaria sp. Z1313 TaxID=3423202 RepID=UPI003D30395C
MGRKARDPREWHGHRIVTEDDLVTTFDDHDPEHVNDPHYYYVRLRRAIVLVLLLGLIAAAVVTAYLVSTRQLVIPWLEPEAPPSSAPAGPEPACPVDVYAYLDPATVRVNVYNATKISGLARAASNQLRQRGFQIGEVGNKSLSDPGVVAAVVAGPRGREQALTLQRHLSETEFVKDGERGGTTIDLVLGQDYDGLVPEGDVVAEPGALHCPRAAEQEAEEGAGTTDAP